MNKIKNLIRYLYLYLHGYTYKLAFEIIAATPGKVRSKFGFFSYERTEIYLWLDRLHVNKNIHGVTLDIGSGSSNFTKKLFKDDTLKFLNVDMFDNSNVDIVCSVYELEKRIDFNYADNVLCCDVLEHLENPQLAINQMYKIIKPDGKLYISVPFGYREHGSADVKDYFRYTRDGLKILCKDFSIVNITFAGPEKFPYCYFVEAIK